MLNEQNLFIVGSVLLLFLIIIVLILPLFKIKNKNTINDSDSNNNYKNVNLSILKDELTELKFQLENGIISEQQFKNLEYELQVKALETNKNNNNAENPKFDYSPAKYTAWIITLLLPIFIGGTYFVLGNSNSLNPALRETPNELTFDQIISLVQKLETKLKMEPDNTEGWLMLARSYRMLDNHPKAVEAFEKIESEIYKDAELLANYAESLAATNADGLNGKPTQLLEKALQLDSNNAHALFLLGMAFCYYFVFGQVFKFIANFAPASITPAPDIEAYLSFVITMFIAFGITFEVPIVLVALVKLGVLSVKQLKNYRSYFIVLAFVIAAIVTPPDVVSQLALAIPMCLLYEVGILVAKTIQSKSETTESENVENE